MCSLFFSKFKFNLSYRPGSKNVKPDALSHQFDSASPVQTPQDILPPSCVVGAVTWDIEGQLRQAGRLSATQEHGRVVHVLSCAWVLLEPYYYSYPGCPGKKK